MGAILLAAGGKHGETVQMHFRGDGPLGPIVAIADPEGRARGYATHPEAHPPPIDGALDIAGAVGRGILSVVRERADGRAPYNGLVPIETGTIAQDLAHYLAESEQSGTAVALGVFLDQGDVDAAGGFFVHALPGASEEEINQVEENVRGYPGPGELVREGLDADEIADRLLIGLGSRERHYTEPFFHCGCDQGRVLRAVVALGREELDRACAAHETLDVHCRFCAAVYAIAPDEIAALLAAS
jgi:molecular chaperone Hsp33